jgi:hypothetical protein
MAKSKKKPAARKAAKSVKRKAPRPQLKRKNAAGVASPTSTRTEVRSPTKTSTDAYTRGNFTATVTGGAGAGATSVTIKPNKGRRKPAAKKPAPKKTKRIAGKKKATRRNGDGAAAERYEYFHGREPRVVTDVETEIKSHATLSGIGKLVALFIDTPVTNPTRRLKLGNFKGALLAQDAKGKQLYIAGGDQRVDLADFGIKAAHEVETLGYLSEVWYDTVKDHLDEKSGGDAIYQHKFGRNKPVVVYDVMNKLLTLSGGGYDLPEVGIRG